MPSADFQTSIGRPCDPPSPVFGQSPGPPEVSLTAFSAHLPDLPHVPLMDWTSRLGARSSETHGLVSDFCSSGRRFATRFFQAPLTKLPLRFANPSPHQAG